MAETRKPQMPNAPLWEMAFGIGLSGPSLLDPYRVEAMHGLFRSEYPRVERQPPVESLTAYPAEGSPLMGFQQLRLSGFQAIAPSRWWFLSEGQERLVQVQDDFLAHNWRRLALPPEPAPQYSGYETMKTELFEIVDRLRVWKRGLGEELAVPTVAELLYDDFIPLDRPDGTVWRMSEVITMISKGDPLPLAGYSSTWLERVAGYDRGGARTRVTVSAMGTAAPDPSESRPFMRLQMGTRAETGSWDETFRFFDAAHASTHRCFERLTTAEIRATWS